MLLTRLDTAFVSEVFAAGWEVSLRAYNLGNYSFDLFYSYPNIDNEPLVTLNLVPAIHGDSAAEIIQNLVADGGLVVPASSMAEMIKTIRDALGQADEQSSPAEMLWDIS